jgi:hypothetical protein
MRKSIITVITTTNITTITNKQDKKGNLQYLLALLNLNYSKYTLTQSLLDTIYL